MNSKRDDIERLLSAAGWIENGGGDDFVAFAHRSSSVEFLAFDDGRWEAHEEAGVSSGAGAADLAIYLRAGRS